MNCQETRRLFEDALDRRLSGGAKRKFDLHLSRCRPCRDLYEAEQAEHARWFQALNAETPSHALPPDFADRLVASVLARDKARIPFFRRIRLPRWAGLAATLALLAAAFAAISVGEHAVTQYAEDVRLWRTGTTDVSPVAALQTGTTGVSPVDIPPNENLETANLSPTTQRAIQMQNISIKRIAALAGAIALAAAQPAAADGYQYIISGYPAANECRVARSTGIALETGSYRRKSLATDLEARYRTRMSSLGIALNTTEYRAMVIIMR